MKEVENGEIFFSNFNNYQYENKQAPITVPVHFFIFTFIKKDKNLDLNCFFQKRIRSFFRLVQHDFLPNVLISPKLL